jgi:RNA polymerase sigma factor (sigma-70 family)
MEGAVMNTLTTSFVRRLRERDETAWFELWEVFGPVLRGQLTKWGRGRVGVETVRDLTQETLAALSTSIERYDPNRGARFSTWLLSIARHSLGDEIDRRMALKRGGGKRPSELDERFMGEAATAEADEEYERNVFRAKVFAAIRKVEAEADFMQFSVYRMRVFDGLQGKDVAVQLGVSEPTVSRYLHKVRALLRARLTETIATYSFTEEEQREAEAAGLGSDDVMFDEALCDIHHHQSRLLEQDELASRRF